MDIYDYVTASSLEDGDLIIFDGDPLEDTTVIDEGDSIMVKGYSHNSGDTATYLLTPDSLVGLWTGGIEDE